MTITHLNPASLNANPAFSQGTVIPAGSSIVIVGGQNGIGPDGEVVGDSIGAQTEQAMRNLIAVLAEAGATPADVAKLTIILVEGVDNNEGFAASQKVWGKSADGDHRPVRARSWPAGLSRRGRRDRGRTWLKQPRATLHHERGDLGMGQLIVHASMSAAERRVSEESRPLR